MKNFKIEVHTSGATLVAEIFNINLTDHSSDVEKRTLRQALDDHEVIFFPDRNLDPNHEKRPLVFSGRYYRPIPFSIIWMMILRLRW